MVIIKYINFCQRLNMLYYISIQNQTKFIQHKVDKSVQNILYKLLSFNVSIDSILVFFCLEFIIIIDPMSSIRNLPSSSFYLKLPLKYPE